MGKFRVDYDLEYVLRGKGVCNPQATRESLITERGTVVVWTVSGFILGRPIRVLKLHNPLKRDDISAEFMRLLKKHGDLPPDNGEPF